jgi:hypothetical protein
VTYCTYCGASFPEDGRFCIACGREQPADVPGPPPPAAAPLSAGVRASGAAPQAVLPQQARVRTSAFFADAFPGRAPADVVIAAGGGAAVGFFGAWGVLWALLNLVGGAGGALLSNYSEMGVPLALGVPLSLSANVNFVPGAGTIQFPLTGLLVLPLAMFVVGGRVAARMVGVGRPREVTWMALLVSIGITVLLLVMRQAVHASTSFEGTSAGVGLAPSPLWLIVYGFFWSFLGAWVGGAWRLAGSRRLIGQTLATELSELVRERRWLPPLVASGRAAWQAVILCAFIIAVLTPIGMLLGLGSKDPGAAFVGIPLLMWLISPALTIVSILFSQGIAYQVSASYSFGSFVTGGGTSVSHSAHLWSSGSGLITLVVTAIVGVSLYRAGAWLVARDPLRTGEDALVRGALVAPGWVLIMLLAQKWGTVGISSSALGVSDFDVSIGPSAIQTILFGGLFAAAFGAWGGSRAAHAAASTTIVNPFRWRPVRSPIAPTAAAAPRPAPPAPAPSTTATTPDATASPFCTGCGQRFAAGDIRFCESCGTAREAPS